MPTAKEVFSEGLPESPFEEELQPYVPKSDFCKPEPAGTTKTTNADAKNKGSGTHSPVKTFAVTLEGTGAGTPPTVTKVKWLDKDGHTLLEVSGLHVASDVFYDGTTQSSATDLYEFWTSLFVGKINVTGSQEDDSFLEVGVTGQGTVSGRGGDDTLYLWHQKNVDFNGGAGVDTLALEHFDGNNSSQPLSGAVVNLAAGTGKNPFGGTLTISNVENVRGQFGVNNDIRGDDADNFLRGGTKVDKLRGLGGDDTIYVKYFDGTGERGTLADGGSGRDKLVAELSLFDFVGSGPGIIFVNVLDLLHPEKNRGTFSGGSFANFEIYQASAGTQYERFDFRGSSENERASGSFGPDILDGRKGKDTLSGFGASDHFVFSTPLSGATNVDTITDFVHGGDTIDLKNSVFAAIGGTLGTGEFRKGASAADGNDHIIYKSTTGQLFYDSDGQGGHAQVLFAILGNKPALAADDFDVI